MANEAIVNAFMDAAPALAGGRPARATPTRWRVVLDAQARRDAESLIIGGELSDWRGGAQCRRFESEFARYHARAGAVAVNSGTSALHCAYAAVGLERGDEVIVPAAAYVSAASAAIQEGAVPVVCDIDPQTLSLDPACLEKRITPRTKVIAPVHLWGIPADMTAIAEIARRHGLAIVEDCAQAHGARCAGRLVGTFGVAAAYSFAPGKVISTGQGGMVLCGDAAMAERARSIANKGKGDDWLAYLRLGCSYVMPDFEALVGLSELRRLAEAIAARRAAADIYREVLAGTELRFPSSPRNDEHSYFKFPIRLPERLRARRDAIIEALSRENVGARATHPPMHTIPWLARLLNGGGALTMNPVAERELPLVIELETGPGLDEEEMRLSALAVLRVYRYFAAGA